MIFLIYKPLSFKPFFFFSSASYMYKLFIFISLLLIVEARQIKTKVVILGAGAAGISAAKTLTDLKLNDFIILDAQSFVGGLVLHTHTHTYVFCIYFFTKVEYNM